MIYLLGFLRKLILKEFQQQRDNFDKATPNKFYGPGFPTDPVLGILGFIFISDPIPCNFENCKIRFSNSSDIPLDLSLDSTTQHYTLFLQKNLL